MMADLRIKHVLVYNFYLHQEVLVLLGVGDLDVEPHLPSQCYSPIHKYTKARM